MKGIGIPHLFLFFSMSWNTSEEPLKRQSCCCYSSTNFSSCLVLHCTIFQAIDVCICKYIHCPLHYCKTGQQTNGWPDSIKGNKIRFPGPLKLTYKKYLVILKPNVTNFAKFYPSHSHSQDITQDRTSCNTTI